MTLPIHRRELLLGAMAMTLTGPARKYRIVDPHVHVWVHDPHYPWAAETKEPPQRDATPAMLL